MHFWFNMQNEVWHTHYGHDYYQNIRSYYAINWVLMEKNIKGREIKNNRVWETW